MATGTEELLVPPVANLLVLDTDRVQSLLWGLSLAKATAENMTATWTTTAGTWPYNALYAVENSVWSLFGGQKLAAGSVRIDLPKQAALEAIAADLYANRLAQFYEVCKTNPVTLWTWLSKQAEFRDKYRATIDTLFRNVSGIDTQVANTVGTFAAVWASIKLVSEVALTVTGAAPALTGSIILGQFLVGVGYAIAVVTVSDGSNAQAVALSGTTSAATNLPGALTGDPFLKNMEIRVFQWAKVSRKNANIVKSGTRSAARILAAQKAASSSAWLTTLGKFGLVYGKPVLKGLNVVCILASVVMSAGDFLSTMEELYAPAAKK